MPDLLTRPLLRRAEPTWGSRVPWFAAIVAAGWVLIASLSLSTLPAVAVWISGGANGPLTGPLRFGARSWLSSHRIALDIGGTDFLFAPLGMTILFVLLMHRSARWAAHEAGVATPRAMLAVIAPAALLYGLGAAALAAFASSGDVTASPLMSGGVATLWASAGFAVGVVHETGFDEVWLARLSPEVRAALAGSGAALAGLVVVGSVLTAAAAVMNSERVGSLAEALDAGAMGNTALAVGSAAIVPNAIVWATSFALGPGFAVGADTVVAPSGVELGLLPAIPPLGALPDTVPETITWLVLLGPIAVGVMAGILVERRLAPMGEHMSVMVLAAGGCGAAAAIGMSALAELSGGSAGAARLSHVGPIPWEIAAMTFLVVGLPAMIVTTLLALRRMYLAKRDERTQTGGESEQVP